MSVIREISSEVTVAEALSSKDVLALLLPRIRIALPQIKDKRKFKQTEELLAALEELEKVLCFHDECELALSVQSENPFFSGLPRCTFQIENQFGHYVNPESPWRMRWRELRLGVWEVFEKTIPWTVREMLLSWRWTAELAAFKQMQMDLERSRNLVNGVERSLTQEERRSQKKGKAISLTDRLRILLWSRSAKRDEDVLLALEQMRDDTQNAIADKLGECERLASATAVGVRTLFVDCGELYPRVFEDCTRAMDKSIRMQAESDLRTLESRLLSLKIELEERLKTQAHELKKTTDKQEKVLQMVENKAGICLADAERLISHEFMCLNAFEIEKQDEARGRWQRAVTQMNRVLQTAEESFENVEIHARDADGDGSGRAAAPQIRI